ncbi:Protein transport protein sec20 [Maudiozyma exigua]|uniref:Protein transport protein sec20 n=1 Tax=Maudiozyma exigua TaxID=34358 RepID=A0A9P6VTZ4_MAUEX|nr:Protein transport protein sec20 [Kazachstania exigua]
MLQYVDDLKDLKFKMLDQLSKLNSCNNEINEDSTLNDTTEEVNSQSISEECTKLILQFESILKVAIVSINQSNKNMKLTYIQSQSLDDIDSLKISGSNFNDCKPSLIQTIKELIVLTNWNYEFKQKLKQRIQNDHYDKLSQIDELRNEAIEKHSQLRTKDTIKDTRTVDIQASSTKSQLLSQTKKLSNNLIKGNQILQSSILQSNLNLDELRQQTSSLQTVDDKYDQFQSIVTKTSSLVKSLEKASNQEKRDVYLALFFLIACISWVIWRRILKMPVKLFLWMCFKFFKSILVAIGMVQSTMKNSTLTSSESVSGSKSLIITATDSLEKIVDDVMDRILDDHDEL